MNYLCSVYCSGSALSDCHLHIICNMRPEMFSIESYIHISRGWFASLGQCVKYIFGLEMMSGEIGVAPHWWATAEPVCQHSRTRTASPGVRGILMLEYIFSMVTGLRWTAPALGVLLSSIFLFGPLSWTRSRLVFSSFYQVQPVWCLLETSYL